MKRYITNACLALIAFAPAAMANLSASYVLNSTNISGGTGPFVSVLLEQIGAGLNGAGEVRFTVTLESGATQFAKTGGQNHETFAFNTNTNVTVSGLPGGLFWDVKNTAKAQSDGGSYNNGIKCSTACGNGSSSPDYTGPLVFDVTAAGLTINNFVVNASGNLFSADILTAGAQPGTGLVFGGTPETMTPEPGSYMSVLAIGIAGLAFMRKRTARIEEQGEAK